MAKAENKTETVKLFQCPACREDVEGRITMAFDLAATPLPDVASALDHEGRARVNVDVKAVGLKVEHDCHPDQPGPAPRRGRASDASGAQ